MRLSRCLYLLLFMFVSFTCFAQYDFRDEVNAGCTSVKNQQKTGTCWSFATCSFLESELIKNGKGHLDLSEMFVVRNIYKDKARNYVLRQGKANFSQGSLAHDFVNTVGNYGIVPETVYDGKEQTNIHNHSEMEAVLKGMLDGLKDQKKLSTKWKDAFDAVLTTYIGEYPDQFTYDGQSYTPRSFAMSLGLDPNNYINVTSFIHHPFGDAFILEIPDNYSNGSYFNVPLTDLERIVDQALNAGYTVAWDGDVSEKGFSSKNGIAVLPGNLNNDTYFDNPVKELAVNQDNRQEAFEAYATTDDHLMHIVGIAKDKKDNKYYKIKNSWGEIGAFNGYMYMSMAYFNMKTVALTVNKKGLPADISERM